VQNSVQNRYRAGAPLGDAPVQRWEKYCATGAELGSPFARRRAGTAAQSRSLTLGRRRETALMKSWASC
jgi:hypothetical protein